MESFLCAIFNNHFRETLNHNTVIPNRMMGSGYTVHSVSRKTALSKILMGKRRLRQSESLDSAYLPDAVRLDSAYLPDAVRLDSGQDKIPSFTRLFINC